MDFKLIDSHVHFEVKGYDIAGIQKEYVEKYGAEKWQTIQSKNVYQTEKWKKAWGFPQREPVSDDVKHTAA